MRIALDRGDRELAATLIQDWLRIARETTRHASTLVELLIIKRAVSSQAGFFHQSAKELGLEEEAALLEAIHEKVREIEEHRLTASTSSEQRDGFQERVELKASLLGAVMTGSAPALLLDPPDPPTVRELRPTRRMEHAYFERMMIIPVALVTVAGIVTFGFFWMRAGGARRAFARRAMRLVPGLRLMLSGFLAGAGPLLGYLAITRLTPLGWHEWSLHHGARALFLQWALLAFLILCLPRLIAAILFEKSARAFGWRWPGGSGARTAAAICIIAALPAAGAILPDTGHIGILLWWLSLGCVAVLTLSGIATWWLQRGDPLSASPRRLAAGLFTAHTRLLALALLAGWALLTQYEEKAWAARDTIFLPISGMPALNSHEAEVQYRLQAQLLDILGPARSD